MGIGTDSFWKHSCIIIIIIIIIEIVLEAHK